ncbi:MAG: hypothetical protein NVSMB27_47210 [Ktedonobacteraceae bacterium]
MMNNQPFQPTTSQHKTIVGISLLAFYLLVSIIIAFIAPHKDYASLYINILASFAIIGGLLGLLIYVARQFNWPLLPAFLQVPEDMRDTGWRLLALSLAAIAMPLLIIFTRSVLFHQ